METVRIITRGNLTGLIFQHDAPCAHTVGALAVTAAPDGAHSFDLSHWDVTHKGTGYRVTRESMPKSTAIALADRMAADARFPWESMKTDMTREQRKLFADIRDEHLKAVTAASEEPYASIAAGRRVAINLSEAERDVLVALIERQASTCSWTPDDDGIFHTDCGHAFYFDGGGGPVEHQQKFCGYCGKTLVEVPPATEEP